MVQDSAANPPDGAPAQRAPTQEALLWLAVERGLLSQDDATRLVKESTHSSRTPLESAVDEGLLNPAQAEFLSAIAEPQRFINGYEVLDLIGFGGMGVVYRAKQENLDREVALKTLRLSSLDNPTLLGRTEVEAQVIANLRHPNIVAAYDYGTHDGKVYLALELVEGEDLCTRLDREGALDESLVWAMAHQVAAALAYANELDVVHRDIKPANLLLTDPLPGFGLRPGVPMVKVTDFGLALRANTSVDQTRLTLAGAALGTLAYVAPEQLQESTVDLRADVFALGASVFHMLAGDAPFAGTTPMKVLIAKTTGDASWRELLPKSISPESRQLFRDMTESEPEARLGGYGELLERIERLLDRKDSEGLLQTTAFLQPRDGASQEKRRPVNKATKTESPVQTRRISILAASFAILLGVSALLLYLGQPKSRALVDADLPNWTTRNSERIYFFTGKLPTNGRPQGLWNDAQGDEGELVMAGSSGSYTLPLRTAEGRFLTEQYLFRVNIKPRQASRVEVHFGRLEPEESATRLVVQISGGQAQLGLRPGADATFKPFSEFEPVRLETTNPLAYQTLSIRRWPEGWAVSVNGTSLGTIAAVEGEEFDRIQFFVNGGEAHFADIEGLPLIEANSEVGS